MPWQNIALTKPSNIKSAEALAELQVLATENKMVMVHPFQLGIGEGDMPVLLSFPNAVESIAVKFEETKPEAATLIGFADSTMSGLSELLKSAIETMGINCLLTPQKRAELLNSLEQDKTTILTPSAVPTYSTDDHTILHVGAIANCYRAKSIELANTEGQNEVGDIAQELTDFETLKTDHDSVASTVYDNVDIGETNGYSLHLSGGNLASQLRDSGGPGSEKSLSVIIAFMGSVETLKPLTQWVGL